MKKYESYAASYPLAYYELGTIYSFYGQTNSTGTLATAEQIRKYASVLQELEADESTINGVYNNSTTATAGRPSGAIGRYYAVVVDKVNAGSNSYIVVMLCNKNNGRTDYYTRKYAVNSSCFTDSKNLMQPSTHLSFSNNKKPAEKLQQAQRLAVLQKLNPAKKLAVLPEQAMM